MCLWNRRSRIDEILTMLDGQDFPDGVELYLWNNNRADHAYYRDAVASFKATGALKLVELAKSPHNVGSIGRFYWAREIAKRAAGSPVVVVDDDQDFSAQFVGQAMTAFDSNTIAGWWAWTIDGGYWDRTPANKGDRVDHIGPGGSVMPAALFLDDEFFTGIPDQFGLLDDLWLSYYAKSRGLRLEKLDIDLEFVMDETNQHHRQGYVKVDFFNYLYPRR